MQHLKAQVKDGRLTLDVPTDLPDGTVVPLEVSPDWDELDDEERTALHREIATSISERRSGAANIDGHQVLAELGPNTKP